MGRNVVVLGTQWGDEGKGKIVDLLTEQAAAVVPSKVGITQDIHWLSRVRNGSPRHPLGVFFVRMLSVLLAMVWCSQQKHY